MSDKQSRCYNKDLGILTHSFKWDEKYTIAVDGVVQCANCHNCFKPSEARESEKEHDKKQS